MLRQKQRLGGDWNSDAGALTPSPGPHLFNIERIPSQPSLTHSNNTDHSDECATTPTSVAHPPNPISPPSKDLGGGTSVKMKKRREQSLAPPAMGSADPTPLLGPSFSDAPFVDRRSKRLSLSRSLQNLRESRAEKRERARSARLSTPADKFSSVRSANLPPVPTIPDTFRRKKPDSESDDDRRRAASATPPMHSFSAPVSSVTTPTGSPGKKSGLGAFFRRLTGRSKESKENITYTRRATTVIEPVVKATKPRPMSYQPPVVAAPPCVQSVLAEMGAASSATERRYTYRKSMIKRVPVPLYDPDSDVIIRPNSANNDKDAAPVATNAAEARAAALAALEGSPRPQSTPRLPSASEDGSEQSVIKTPESKRPDLVTLDSDDSGPIIHNVNASPAVITHVVVMEPEQIAGAEVDLANDLPAMISPREQSVKIVGTTPRSPSTSSAGSGTMTSVKRMSKSTKLSDFGTYDSSDASDENADTVEPLKLRISPRSAIFDIHDLPATPEDGPESPLSASHVSVAHSTASHTMSTDEFGHTTIVVRRSSTKHSIRSVSSRDARFAGSRSAYVAPIGDGLILDSHNRNTTSGRVRTLSRRMSNKPPREPPTSHDAYQQKQAELLARRQSCRPVIHSRASIAAELTEVRDKEANKVMETFFMS